MDLRVIKLPKDDPHVLAFRKGRYDGITSRVRWLLLEYRNYVNPFGDLIYKELQRQSAKFGVDVRRLIWALLKNNADSRLLDASQRIAARGALAVLLISKQLSSGFSGDEISASLDLLEKKVFPDRDNPPFDGTPENTAQALVGFARWAKQVLLYDIKVGWNVKAIHAQKDVKALYEATYGKKTEVPEDYILWDLQEGLSETTTPFPAFGARARRLMRDQFRWLLRMKFAQAPSK